MATKEGYVNGVSWFRTHPPFYERMVQAQREIMFLPKGRDLLVQTTEFEQMKKDLAPVVAQAEKEEGAKPSLLITKEEGCTPPQKIEYKPGQPIEQICSARPKSADPAMEWPDGASSGTGAAASRFVSSQCVSGGLP
ncbi:hypothetical protein SBA5_720019 [Candidatus Sulfotelmatomonas gaucii]|uniref:Uncharacterized protein n=1 Tax=Candidatus Sulfuritelmatomonas gaucii TaxID=2043161 RepID=A0A2N9M341_9BACT|nr:hypothetical protein SBA5_720019 [Candidatus Sulfotelmatomonas gaucii]